MTGFYLLDGTTKVCPDRGLRGNPRPRVLIAKFGDGYEQRAKDGINTIEKEYNIAFRNRPVDEIADILEFFEEKAGVEPFTLTLPNHTEVRVVCDRWSEVYTNSIANGCDATLRRVFEP